MVGGREAIVFVADFCWWGGGVETLRGGGVVLTAEVRDTGRSGREESEAAEDVQGL